MASSPAGSSIDESLSQDEGSLRLSGASAASLRMTTRKKNIALRMPAEWEPHEATWIAWPHNESDWPGKFSCIPFIYAEIVRHLARVEKLHIIVQDASA